MSFFWSEELLLSYTARNFFFPCFSFFLFIYVSYLQFASLFICQLVRSYGQYVLILYECYRSDPDPDIWFVANQMKIDLVDDIFY